MIAQAATAPDWALGVAARAVIAFLVLASALAFALWIRARVDRGHAQTQRRQHEQTPSIPTRGGPTQYDRNGRVMF